MVSKARFMQLVGEETEWHLLILTFISMYKYIYIYTCMCKIDIHTSPWLASYLLVHGTLLLQIHVNENIECNPQLHGMTNHYEPLRTIKQKTVQNPPDTVLF